MTVAGLLLAAGAGRRLGRPKALVRLDDRLLVDRGVEVLAAGGCAPVYVVLGAERRRVAREAALADAVVVDNDDWADGMASSLRAGLAALPAEVRAVVVALVDQPLVSAVAVGRLVAAAQRGAVIAVATYDGARRNPVLLHRDVWAAVSDAAHGDVGARAYYAGHPELVTDVECGDVAAAADVDTEDDLAAVRKFLAAPGQRSPF